jgi:hypothetical protein
MVEKKNDSSHEVADEDGLDSEVIFKPRTDFSNKVLRKVVPSMNLRKQKVSVSQNI